MAFWIAFDRQIWGAMPEKSASAENAAAMPIDERTGTRSCVESNSNFGSDTETNPRHGEAASRSRSVPPRSASTSASVLEGDGRTTSISTEPPP